MPLTWYAHTVFLALALSVCGAARAQRAAPEADILFDFNDHTLAEAHNQLTAKAAGIVFIEDRFGNPRSAVFTSGTNNSYLNLGTSPRLKPRNATIALWVNITRRVYSGKGYDFNPLIMTKNGPQPDYYNAWCIAFETQNGRFSCGSSRDSVLEVTMSADERVQYDRWYHLVYTFSDDSAAFYVNGSLRSVSRKGFPVQYHATDSVMVGHSASLKNHRFSSAAFDDIAIFHRVLSPAEVQALFEAPDPYRLLNTLRGLWKYALVVALLIAAIVLWYRQKLSAQRRQMQLNSRMAELEIKAIKAQMNPHFISNSLAAIQELIYTGNIEMAGQYLARFSLFLRQVLEHSDRTFVTLEEELKLLSLATELERLRFRHSFEVTVNVDPSIDPSRVFIPSLITQPFVENAIWHGLLPLKGTREAKLTVDVKKDGERIVIHIGDNGVGRTASPAQTRASKGTRLISDKLESLNRLTGSASYAFHIRDEQDKNGMASGTTVTLELKDYAE